MLPSTLGNGRALPQDKGLALKLYGSDTDASANGSAPLIDDDEQIEEDEFQGSEYDYSQLFEAPSYSQFIKSAPNSKAKSYEKRVQSMMKAGVIMSINSRNYPDAATFLKLGPGFATAAGNLAADNSRAAQIIDMLTAPESSAVMFAMVAIPFVSQLLRNHQGEVETAAKTWRQRRQERKQAKLAGATPANAGSPITVRFFKREFKLPIKLRFKFPNLRTAFSAFLAPTQHPQEIAAEVFNDPDVVKALHKMGLVPQEPVQDDAA